MFTHHELCRVVSLGLKSGILFWVYAKIHCGILVLEARCRATAKFATVINPLAAAPTISQARRVS